MSKCNGDSSEGPVQRVGLTETSDNCEARLVSFTPFIPTSGPVTVSPPLENTPRLASIRELSDVTAQAVRSMLPTGRDNDDDEILLDAADVDVMQNYEQQTQRQSDEGQKENTDTQEATSSPLTTSRLAKPEMHVVYDAAWIRKKFHIGDEFLRAPFSKINQEDPQNGEESAEEVLSEEEFSTEWLLSDFHMPEDSETADIKKTLDIIMESVFNFPPDSYRQNQLEAMVAATLGNDIVICLPTGFGKSLCFQAPALYSGYGDDTRGDAPLTVVVSPLTSLMENQVQSLWDLNIKAIRLARTQAMDKGNRARFLLPEARILYLTPERLKTDLSLQKDLDERYECGRLRRFVIDEAHCVAENGTSNFRKDYLKLDQIRTRWERVPITLLSATFTAQTLQRTLKALRISTSPYLFKTTLDRPNLYWEVRRKHKDYMKDVALIIANESKARNGSFSGIVYNFSQKSCVELADALRKYGISAFHYHADLEEPQKANIQSLWQSGVIKVVVATVAFGLGIDKQDVGFVIHAAVPKTLEGLYQEAGRAGRDGRKAKCILYYDHQDVMKWIALGDGKESPLTDGQLSDLEKVRDYAQDHSTCRRVRILQHFGDNSFDPITCNRNCDNCFNPQHTQTDVTHYAKELVLLLQSGQRERTRFTVLKLVDHYTNKGPRSQSTSRMGSRNEQAVTKDFLLDIVAQLVTLKVFELNRVPGHSKHFLYLQMGRAAPRLSNGTLLIYIYFHESHVAATATTKARKRKADDRV